jgi:SAM-dependent methyltransferase
VTAVPPELYDRAYYLGACAGHAEFAAGGAHPQYAGYLDLAGLRAGETLVDLGAGRGELVAEAARRGAEAIGIEYSADAVALAHERGADVRHADVRAVPLPDGCADLVTLLDVVEHLAPSELAAALAEARRLLRPGGRVLVHTFPNRLVYNVTYPLLGVRDGRVPYERAMHVNEQTARSLRRALRAAGLRDVRVEHGAMVHDGVLRRPRARSLVHRLAAHRVTRPLGAADLWGRARR